MNLKQRNEIYRRRKRAGAEFRTFRESGVAGNFRGRVGRCRRRSIPSMGLATKRPNRLLISTEKRRREINAADETFHVEF